MENLAKCITDKEISEPANVVRKETISESYLGRIHSIMSEVDQLITTLEGVISPVLLENAPTHKSKDEGLAALNSYGDDLPYPQTRLQTQISELIPRTERIHNAIVGLIGRISL